MNYAIRKRKGIDKNPCDAAAHHVSRQPGLLTCGAALTGHRDKTFGITYCGGVTKVPKAPSVTFGTLPP